MPIQRKKKSSRPSRRPLARRMRGYRRRNYAPRSRRVNDYAGCSESILFTAIQGANPSTGVFTTGVKNTTFNVYRNTDIQLSTFARAPAIAANYQYYRIKYMELQIVPDADTFTGVGGQAGKPFFYYMIDKGNTINNAATNQDLKAMGAKPIPLDETTIKIRWKPAVVLANEIQTSTGTTSAQQKMVSPWLNTDSATTGAGFQASPVCHYGIKFFAENFGATLTYTATLTAHFEFKKPLYVHANTSVPEGAIAQ